MSMGKRNLGWLRQRRVAVASGVIWCLLLIAIAFFLWETHIVISGLFFERNAEMLGNMYYALIGFPGIITFIGFWRQCNGWQAVLTIRLILILAIVVVFGYFFASSIDGMASYIGTDKPEPGLVSTYDVLFIYVLFVLCASFQCWLIASERRRNELTSVVGGVLMIMGILMPRLLESYSILSAHCSMGACALGDVDGIALFKMGIACAAALAVMFVIGLFSETIVQFIRSSEEELSVMSRESSLADSHNAEVSVPASGAAIASDKQNKESEELPASSSVATRVSQESADGAVVPAQATERLASACGPGVAVPKQLMSAAVSGLVAGVCFSVASRLFGRR